MSSLTAFSFLEGLVALSAVLSFSSRQKFSLVSCKSVISGDGNGIRLGSSRTWRHISYVHRLYLFFFDKITSTCLLGENIKAVCGIYTVLVRFSTSAGPS